MVVHSALPDPLTQAVEELLGPAGVEHVAHGGSDPVVAAARAAGDADAIALIGPRSLGPFDAHGDPVDPPVWLWRADVGWRLTPERPL